MKKNLFTSIYLIFFVFPCYTQTVVQMKRIGAVSSIDCKVNNLKLSFIFDTGASDVCISLTEASFMLKNGYLNPNDIIGVSTFSDATGKISEGYKIILRQVEFAGLIMYNVRATIVKNLNAPLLFGQSAISKLGKIQLDLSLNTLTLIDVKKSYDYSNTENYSSFDIPANSYTFLVVLKEYSDLNTARIAYNKLISYGHKIYLISNVSNIHKLVMPFNLPVKTSTVKRDSLETFFGGKPYLIFK